MRTVYGFYNEINDYNREYWSKFLCCFWLLWGVVVIVGVYIIAFVPMPAMVRIFWFYMASVNSIIFLFIISMAASVQYKAYKSYKLFNSLFVAICMRNDLRNKCYLNSLYSKMKVICFYKIYLLFNKLLTISKIYSYNQ